MPRISKVLEENVRLKLVLFGLVLIVAANTFHFTILKVPLDRVVAEVGALILIVGVLHFFYEMRIRQEMLREVAASVLENQRIHNSGVSDCLVNSRDVNEAVHWEQAKNLTVGIQYSSRFFEDFRGVLESRCAAGKETTVLALKPESDATRYLKGTHTGLANVAEGLQRIRALLDEASADSGHSVPLLQHDRVLRYSFIRTEEAVWIKFFANSLDRTTVPAMRFRANTPLYNFVSGDVDRLIAAAKQ